VTASREFCNYVAGLLEGLGPVNVRRMFGGAGLFLDGLMFALIADVQLYLKSDAGNEADFEAEGLGPFTYATKNGERGVMAYRRAPERCLEDPEELAFWARKSFEAALRANSAKKSPRRKNSKKVAD